MINLSIGTIATIFGIGTAILSIITFFIGRVTSVRNNGYDAGIRDAKIENSLQTLTEKIDQCIDKIDNLTTDKVEKVEYNKLISIVETLSSRISDIDGKGDLSEVLHSLKN